MADKFEQFAIVELFGHQIIAGLVSEQVIGGQGFVRVDVPTIGERAEIAGSVRRGKPDVKDIEIVAMPILKPPVPQFGDRLVFKTALDRLLHQMLSKRAIEFCKNGDKYKQFWAMADGIHLIKIDLFLVTPPAQWGVIDLIRTGPAEFSHWMVTSRDSGGALPREYCVSEGGVRHLEHVEDVIPMPEEADYFTLCGMEWIEPSKREPHWGRGSSAPASPIISTNSH